MSIDDIFKKYPENIFGFRITPDHQKVVDFWIKNEWVIPEDTLPSDAKIKKQKASDNGVMNYYILFSPSTTFLNLFNIVSNIIEYNLEVEKKRTLFEQKMNELKRIFMETNYDDLKGLQFDIALDKSAPIENISIDNNE
jgi:hypothetical protein